MSNYAKYSRLIDSATTYGKRMKYLSNRIFGEVARPTNITSMKVVKMFEKKPAHLDREIVNYYPRHWETHYLCMKLRDYGLFRDEHEDFKDEMKRMRALRGKAPPARGEGKRSKK